VLKKLNGLVASLPILSNAEQRGTRDKMSSSAKAEADICCANCGIPEVDEVKTEEEECASKMLHSDSDKCHEEQRKVRLMLYLLLLYGQEYISRVCVEWFLPR